MAIPVHPQPPDARCSLPAPRRRFARQAALGVVAFGLSIVLLHASLHAPVKGDPWLSIALVMALPWSLASTGLELTAGFADRAAWVVSVGLALNVTGVIVALVRVCRRNGY